MTVIIRGHTFTISGAEWRVVVACYVVEFIGLFFLTRWWVRRRKRRRA